VVEIEARGRRHVITVELDRIAQEPKIACDLANLPSKHGTILKVHWPDIACYFSGNSSELYRSDGLSEAVQVLIEDYAAFNPHVTFTFNGNRRIAATPAFEKWRTDAPTSAHWYRPEDLRALIAAHIKERDMFVRDFVSNFAGLARTRVLAEVLAASRLKGKCLGDLVRGNDVSMPSVTRLLKAMQDHSRPVQPKRFGMLGREHLQQHFCSLGVNANSFNYERKAFFDDKGLPVLLETAFAIWPDASETSRRIIGLNWSPILKIPSGAINDAISSCHVSSYDPVVLLLHAARPRFEFTDHGKGALA
jgi:hypothetical protein